MSEKSSTEAEKWLFALRLRCAALATVEQANDALQRTNADFPNTFFNLTNGGQVIGWRRVFGDRSYAEGYHNKPDTVTCDRMSEGMLGTAGNGRLIM